MKFSEKVYRLTKRIPKGCVSTYGEVARALNTKAYRAVGNALNRNPYSPTVPCHRIVNSNGFLSGFAQGVNKKIELLEKEGIKIKNKKIVDFDKKFFRLNLIFYNII